MHRYVRSHLAAGGAVASAGILALSLVAAPPDSHGARTEARAVQLAVLALPSAVPSGAILEELFDKARTAIAATPVGAAGAADITTAAVTTSLASVRVVQPTGSQPQAIRATTESAIDPAIDSQQVDSAALPETTTANVWDATLPIVGPIILFGLLILVVVFVVLVCPPCALFNVGYTLISGILFGDLVPILVDQALAVDEPSTPTAEALGVTTNSLLRNSTPATTATAGPADAEPATEGGKADDYPPVTPDDTPTQAERVTTTGTHQMSTEGARSTKDASETAKTDEALPAKPAGRPATPRPVVRDSLGVDDQLRDPSHRGNGGHLTTRTAAADEGAAATAGPSEVASPSAGSSATDRDSSVGDSSDGDADGSE
jgi:hypothetical protein